MVGRLTVERERRGISVLARAKNDVIVSLLRDPELQH